MDDFVYFKDMLNEFDSQATPLLGMRIIKYLNDEGEPSYDIDLTAGFDTPTYLGVLEWAKAQIVLFARDEGKL